MKRIDYSLFDPSGNVTILVTTPVPVEDQPGVAARLMELVKSAEQTGFISADGSLRMAGGEFCGNASMCAAALRLIESGEKRGEISLSVSGAEGEVRVTAERNADGAFSCGVSMPRPHSIGAAVLGGRKLPLVEFSGISHVILEETPDKNKAEKNAKEWCAKLGADALGLMFLDLEGGVLTPLVYVPAVETLFWESACGSGACAVAAYLESRSGERETLSLRQPGGVLTAEAEPDGALTLHGSVRLIERKTVEL